MGKELWRISFFVVALVVSAGWATRKIVAPPYTVSKPLPKPALFAEGIISVRGDELGGAFTPDGSAFYFSKRTPTTTSRPLSFICVSYNRNGKWSTPEIAPFSGRHTDSSPFISSDGSKFFFTSFRSPEGGVQNHADIWMMTKTSSGWSEPTNLGAPVNSPAQDQNATLTADGTLYFSSSRSGSSYDIYRSKLVNGHYQEPENAGVGVNTEFAELHPYISRDEQYLFFATIGRSEIKLTGGSPYARSDIYMSQFKNGEWEQAKSIDKINSIASEYYPFISPDGKYLFFCSDRGFTQIPMAKKLSYQQFEDNLHSTLGGSQNIYQIDLGELITK